MSKNFELLRNVGRSSEVFQTETEVEAESEPTAFTVTDGPLPVAVEGIELDEFTKFVSRVFLSGTEAPRQVAFTGIEPGSGSSRICVGAAEVLAAHASGSVCLLDANLRTPTLHKQFGVENHFGLTEALQQTGSIRKYARRFPEGNLSLITSGSPVDNWQALLASQQMQTRMAELRREFDYVLVDIPPLSVFANGLMLGGMSEGLILVLKAHSSRRKVAQQIVKELRAANVNLLGAILNERRFPIPNGLYQRL